jgi:hypothetical protein
MWSRSELNLGIDRIFNRNKKLFEIVKDKKNPVV